LQELPSPVPETVAPIPSTPIWTVGRPLVWSGLHVDGAGAGRVWEPPDVGDGAGADGAGRAWLGGAGAGAGCVEADDGAGAGGAGTGACCSGLPWGGEAGAAGWAGWGIPAESREAAAPGAALGAAAAVEAEGTGVADDDRTAGTALEGAAGGALSCRGASAVA
jgi:hypothetical protein